MTLRAVLAAQGSLKGRGMAQNLCLALSLPLHSPEPPSLTCWRMPKLSMTTLEPRLFRTANAAFEHLRKLIGHSSIE